MAKKSFWRRWLNRLGASLRCEPALPRGRGRSGRPSFKPWLENLENRLVPATTLSIANSSVLEPAAGGTVNMDFTVTRSGDLTAQITVGYTTVAGTAQPTTDFTPTTGTVVFPSGAATETLSIPIIGNGVYNNPNLSFSVRLTGIVNVVGPPVTLANQQTFATGTNPESVVIGDLNGDGKPDLVVANAFSASVSVLLNTTAPGATTPSFATQQTFATGTSPIAVAIGDLNGDGKLDLVVANELSDSVSVLLNTTAPGATTPSFATQQTFATGSSPISVAIGDLNGDGKPDLAVANFYNGPGGNSVSVLLNTTAPGATTGSFATQQTFGTGSMPYSVAVGDLNGDGKPDLAVANTFSNNVSVLLNTTPPGATTPAFAAHQDFSTESNPRSVVIGDLNGDGKPDLAVANDASASLSLLLNTTAPGATTPSFATQQTFATGNAPLCVALGDVNGDGKPDLVVANLNAATGSMLLNTTMPGATTPSFATQQTFATGSMPSSVALSDLNGDGKPDLVVANTGDATVSVLLNTTVLGAATVTPAFPQVAILPVVGSGDSSVAVADLNGDGKSDLVVANDFSASASVLLNTTMAGATTPSFATQQTFATGIGPASVAVGDFNGDGKPDLVFANFDGTVSLLLNTTTAAATTPSFATQQAFATGSASFSVAEGDVNGDGRPDLLAANDSSNTVSVLLNTTTAGATTPSFATQQSFATGTGRSVALGDVNGDGKPDLVVANEGDNTVAVLLNMTTPGATTPSFATQQSFATGAGPRSVALADVNGDGKPDLVIANQGDNTVSVLLNMTAPGATTTSFAPQLTFAAGINPYSVALGDVNGDGKPDLVIANADINSLSVLNSVSVLLNMTTPGATTPSFATQQAFATGSSPRSVALSDVNADGKPDLVVANLYDGTVSVLLNTPVTISGSAATGTITESDALTAQERFVQALYVDELGRAGATSELDGWVAVLNAAGGSQGGVAGAIEHSPEARDHLVKSWYQKFLGRQDANGEEIGWVNLLLRGQTEEQVLSQILGSQEFYQHAQTLSTTGSPDERYVQALYQLLLHPTGIASEVASWVGILPALGRPGVALALLQSWEFRSNLFQHYYNALLHRPDETGGLFGWAHNKLDASTVRAFFEAGSEFFANG